MMTEKEFNQLLYGASDKASGRGKTESKASYFFHFKLRWLICMIFFFGILILDFQFHLKENPTAQNIIALLGEKEIAMEECFSFLQSVLSADQE